MISTVLAQINNKALTPAMQAQQQDGTTLVSSLVPKFLTFAITIGAIVFFFMFVLGAIKWITSGGDKGAVADARGQIVNAIVGVVVLFSVFAVAKIIETFFGFSLITINLGTFFQ